MEHTPHHPDQALMDLAGFRLDADPSPPESLLPEEDPKPSWTANPLIQLAVVATGTGLVFLGLYFAFGNFSFKTASDTPPEPQETNELPVEQSTPNKGSIKTDLAFGAQGDDLAALAEPDHRAVTEPPVTSPSSPSATPPPRPTAPPSVTPVRHSQPPAPLPQHPIAPPIPSTAIADEPEAKAESPHAEDLSEDPLTTSVATIEEDNTLTVVSGTTATAVVATPVLIASDIPLKSQLRLTEPLTAPTGEIVLPTNAILIAEAVPSSQDTDTAYLRIISAVLDGEEHPFPTDAVLALSPAGPIQNSHSQSEDTGLNLEQILLTGAIATLDLDRDDFLSGIALDILDQLSERDTARLEAALAREEAWVIPTETELIVHINQSVTLPAPASPSEDSTWPVRSEAAGDGRMEVRHVPFSVKTVVLQPNTKETISFLGQGETIRAVWLGDPDMVHLSYDAPLASGHTQHIYAELQDDSATPVTTLDVMTEAATGKRRWHRFHLQRG